MKESPEDHNFYSGKLEKRGLYEADAETRRNAKKASSTLSTSNIDKRNKRVISRPEEVARRLFDTAYFAELQSKEEPTGWQHQYFDKAYTNRQNKENPNERVQIKQWGSEHVTLDAVERLESSEIPSTGMARHKGTMSYQQDRALVEKVRATIRDEKQDIEIIAVFDGHGKDGERASRHCKNKFGEIFQKKLEEFEQKDWTDDVKIWNALKLACVDLDTNYSGPGGTTACITVKIGSDLWVANVGDSRAIMVTPEGNVIQLSEDAKPDELPFKRSIKKRGGWVNRGRVKGLLAPARTIGDKKIIGAASNPRPKIVKYPLPEDSSGYLLTVLCDGIPDGARTDQIGRFVHEQRGRDPAEIARMLLSTTLEADERARANLGSSPSSFRSDNLTAIVRKF